MSITVLFLLSKKTIFSCLKLADSRLGIWYVKVDYYFFSRSLIDGRPNGNEGKSRRNESGTKRGQGNLLRVIGNKTVKRWGRQVVVKGTV